MFSLEEYSEKLNWTLRHHLQEILAPVLMNQEPIRSYLGITDYTGNPNLRHLFITQDADADNKINISIYFQNIYEDMRKQGISFNLILINMIKQLLYMESYIIEKYELWKKYGSKIYKDDKLLEFYSSPIYIKK